MKTTIMKIFALILAFTLSSCLKEDVQKMPFTSMTPQNIGDSWDIASPELVGIPSQDLSSILQEYHNNQQYWQIRSMSVFCDGKLIAETYCKSDRDRIEGRPVWSCTKQVLGILLGIAIDRGLIESVNDPINRYLSAELGKYPDKQSITIQDLLTMRSGIGFENYGLFSDDAALLQQKPDDIFKFCISRPMSNKPGENYSYKDSDPQILSAIIEKITGKSTRDWAYEVLFSQIGIENIEWENYKDGRTIGAFGIITTPRELAKIGQLVLNKGTFSNKQIVSQAWINAMLTNHVALGDKSFGYLWWLDTEKNIQYMSGNGGQFVMLKPDKRLMVVVTSEDKTQGGVRLYTSVITNLIERISRTMY